MLYLGDFSHIIAGSTLAFYALLDGSETLTTAFVNFLMPTLSGSILGGIAFVAALNYAQVLPDD
jgi:formate/nitrite transporter FocA (FNT family)